MGERRTFAVTEKHLDRRQFLRFGAVCGVALVSNSCEPVASFVKWMDSDQSREQHAQMQDASIFARKHRGKGEEDAALTDDDQDGLQEEPGSVGSGTESSDMPRVVPARFVLEARPPESLRGYADRATVTSDGRHRWKHQEWLPLHPQDMPLFLGDHESQTYRTIIDHFNVVDPLNLRFQSSGDTTYCNIFVWDVTRAMNVEIPRWIDGVKTWTNSIYDWLIDPEQGQYLGWESVPAYAAQEVANEGYPSLAITEPRLGRLGHVAMVIPGEGEIIGSTFYPMCAQAGKTNFVGKTVYDSLSFRYRKVDYFINSHAGYQFISPEDSSR